MRRTLALTIVAGLAAGVLRAGAQTPNLDNLLARIGERVEDYYNRAQSLMCVEKVTTQPINSAFSNEGFARVVESELHVEWTPDGDGGSPEAKVVRELIKVNGRAPKKKDEPRCLDPNPVSPEPLAFLLPENRGEYVFTYVGPGKGKDANTVLLDFRSTEKGAPSLSAADNKPDGCFSMSIPGRIKGRLWIDPETYRVVRIDQQLTTRVDFRVPPKLARWGSEDVIVLERYDTSIRFKPIGFHDPEEAVLLPESIETLMLAHGAQSYRSHQVFSEYRRFLTGARIVR